MAVATCATLAAGGVTVAQAASTPKPVKACASSKNVLVLQTKGKCPTGSHAVSLGQIGPQGPQGPQGIQGNQGIQGVQGVQGQPGQAATKLFAEISAGASPTVIHGSGVSSVTWSSTFYVVTFSQNISGCAPIATTTGTNGNNTDSRINAVLRSDNNAQLDVRTYVGAAETSVNTINFTVGVLC